MVADQIQIASSSASLSQLHPRGFQQVLQPSTPLNIPQHQPAAAELCVCRCLDLYLCPRVRRMRHNISSDALIPKLPNPKQLEPFPKQLQTMYEGHTARIRCDMQSFRTLSGCTGKIVACVLVGACVLIACGCSSLSFDPTGEWMASCADDHTIRIWEVQRTGN